MEDRREYTGHEPAARAGDHERTDRAAHELVAILMGYALAVRPGAQGEALALEAEWLARKAIAKIREGRR